MVGEIFNTERQKKVHACRPCTAKIYMPTVEVNLPRAFGQCYVLALDLVRKCHFVCSKTFVLRPPAIYDHICRMGGLKIDGPLYLIGLI